MCGLSRNIVKHGLGCMHACACAFMCIVTVSLSPHPPPSLFLFLFFSMRLVPKSLLGRKRKLERMG